MALRALSTLTRNQRTPAVCPDGRKCGTTKELERKLLDEDFLPLAQSARAFVIPLCSVVDAVSVAEKLIAPALALLR